MVELVISEGYSQALQDSELYYSNRIEQIREQNQSSYNDGLNEGRDYFGIYYNGVWLTAEEYADIRYDEGYNDGLSNEINWFSWSSTFFLMPFRILNIEILPGIRIGYFALFSLLLGVVGWFFFIVGKGGGRRK